MLKIAGTPDGSRLACAVALINLAVQSDEDWPERRAYLADAMRRIDAAIRSIDGTSPVSSELAPIPTPAPAPRVAVALPTLDPNAKIVENFVLLDCLVDPDHSISDDMLYAAFLERERKNQHPNPIGLRPFLQLLIAQFPNIVREDLSQRSGMGMVLLHGIRPKSSIIIDDFLDDEDDETPLQPIIPGRSR